MINKPLSTQAEEKILKAAQHVFIQKGYKGATTRDIAAEAGITSPLLNYYFRSKENIFQIVYQRALEKMYYNVYNTIDSEKPLKEKIPMMVERLMGVLGDNPEVPMFIFNEINQNPERLATKLNSGINMSLAYSKFADQVNQEVSQGLIRPIDHVTLLMNLQSLCIYPFIAQKMICQVTCTSDIHYQKLLKNRSQEISDILLSDILPKKQPKEN